MNTSKRWLIASMLAGALTVSAIVLLSKGSAIWFDASPQMYACLKNDLGKMNWRYEGVSGPFHEFEGSSLSVFVRPWVVELRLPIAEFSINKEPGSAIRFEDIEYRSGLLPSCD
jgi:hypothetical protein